MLFVLRFKFDVYDDLVLVGIYRMRNFKFITVKDHKIKLYGINVG